MPSRCRVIAASLALLAYTGQKAKVAAADPRRMWKPGLE